MSYQSIGEAARSSVYLSRVRGCVLSLNSDIIAATQDSGSIQDDSNNDLTTVSCKNWAINYLKGTVAATDEIIGDLILMAPNVANDPYGVSTDGDMQYQLKHVYLLLVGMG